MTRLLNAVATFGVLLYCMVKVLLPGFRPVTTVFVLDRMRPAALVPPFWKPTHSGTWTGR